LSLAQARGRARELLAQVDLGADPQEEKTEARRSSETNTLAALVDRFIEDQAPRWRPRTLTEFRRLADREVVPIFGSRPPQEITRGDVRLWMKQIARTRPTTANRAFEVLRRAYAWAAEEELIEASPLVGLKKLTQEAPRERTHSDAELRRILAAAPGTEYAGIVPLIVWTGVRSHEARSMRWQDIDLRRRVWTIPAKYAKRARRARPAPRVVPLSPPVASLLRELGSKDLGFVFSAATGPCDTCGEPGHTGKNTRPIGVVRKRSGVEDFRLHDLRRTTGQRITDEFGLGRMHLVLGHARGRLAETYAPVPTLKLAREALEWWGEELERILEVNRDVKGRTR
jgi:integrase